MLEIDLHGVRYKDVRKIIEDEMDSLWGKNIELKIVTGHSPELQKIVVKLLKDLGLKPEVGGFLEVDKTYVYVLVH